ncbi:hypothetical protein [Kribbella sp. DT2]|uniref:hypothetical protein n=1 Tax=Kribbella sp. DT2 TaxID=3393427 RepID=UPI003CF753FF
MTLAATASAGLMTSAAGTAQAAEWTYIAAYRYLQDCKDTGNQYVHHLIASTYKCTGTYATGYSLFIKYRIA